jgi:hypothetical protein
LIDLQSGVALVLAIVEVTVRAGADHVHWIATVPELFAQRSSIPILPLLDYAIVYTLGYRGAKWH